MNLVNIIVILLLLPVSTLAYELRGYSIAQLEWQAPLLKNDSRATGAARFQNINRVNYYNNFKNDYKFELGINLNQIYESTYDPLLTIQRDNLPLTYRVGDFNPVISKNIESNSRSYYLIGAVDRLLVSTNLGSSEIILGRQQIYFGSAKMISAIDVFAPFNVAAINSEERSGVDAIRFRKSIGEMGEWDLGLLFGEDTKSENSGAYISFRNSFKNIEIQPILISYKEAVGLGIDLLTSYKGANFYLEALSTNPRDEGSYLRATTGAEYQWRDDLYTIFEFHYNGAGQTKPENYTQLDNTFATTKGGVFYLGQTYINLILNYQIHPLHSLTISGIQNLNDNSTLLSPSWVWSVSEIWEVNAGAFVGIGAKSTTIAQTKSEFGLLGESIYLKAKYYF